jgi:hypothetical protein
MTGRAGLQCRTGKGLLLRNKSATHEGPGEVDAARIASERLTPTRPKLSSLPISARKEYKLEHALMLETECKV